MKKKKILVIGSGFMAREYVKVLANMKHDVTVVGRSAGNIESLKSDYPEFTYVFGGLEEFLKYNTDIFEYAINAVNVSFLKDTTIQLIKHGIKKILLEKPGDLYTDGLLELKKNADLADAKISIAYNRRFYTSVNTLKNEIEKDGGVKSVHFEFTEWVHTISPAMYDKDSLKKWIISNSSHVIDTAFFITGTPKELNAIVLGQNTIEWHPTGSLFMGSGIGSKNIPFTYHSNWESAGRWAIEILTNNRRFFLKPMEKLFVQKKGSVQVEEFLIEDEIDANFKPGLYLQTKAFINNELDKLVSLGEQIETIPFYDKIGGY